MTDRVVNESSKRIKVHYGNGHNGVDIGWRADESQNRVYANCVGVVKEIQTGIPNLPGATGKKSWGNFVLIEHPNGMYTRYAHLKDVFVKVGQHVDENTCIGIIGNTGDSYGRHLHFEVQTGYSASTRINPEPYLTKPVYDGSKPKPEPTDITGDIVYQSYDNNKKQWLPQVVNDRDYAGNFGNSMGGFRAKPKYGKIYMQAHIRNGKWLDTVDSLHYKENSMSGDSYAGLFGMQIDGIKVWSSQGYVSYRAHLLGGGWLPWVNKADNTPEGYAGILGNTIDAIQMR